MLERFSVSFIPRAFAVFLVIGMSSDAVIAETTTKVASQSRGSIGLIYALTPNPHGIINQQFDLDAGAQSTFFKSNWPLQMEWRMVVGGAPFRVDGLFLLELGARREFGVGAIRPYVSGGGGLVGFAFGEHNPFGYWTRAGVDFRLWNLFFLAPFVGYGSYGGPALVPDIQRTSVGLIWIGYLVNQKPPHTRTTH